MEVERRRGRGISSATASDPARSNGQISFPIHFSAPFSSPAPPPPPLQRPSLPSSIFIELTFSFAAPDENQQTAVTINNPGPSRCVFLRLRADVSSGPLAALPGSEPPVHGERWRRQIGPDTQNPWSQEKEVA
ncbi:hypothetical protein EYF80_019619 [Liparis tanakae]|uniref:Uncharacterized protein n=1 Tax=Liparis tanakae TaxID=230148 RepID=A0A4Z2HWA7_9TELE|nr:hypothetical protein EYF80_019619 [Liparis tanakae]